MMQKQRHLTEGELAIQVQKVPVGIIAADAAVASAELGVPHTEKDIDIQNFSDRTNTSALQPIASPNDTLPISLTPPVKDSASPEAPLQPSPVLKHVSFGSSRKVQPEEGKATLREVSNAADEP